MSLSLRRGNKKMHSSSCRDRGNHRAQNRCLFEKKPSWPNNTKKKMKGVGRNLRKSVGSGRRRLMRGRGFAKPWLKQDLGVEMGRGSLVARARSCWRKCRGWWNLEPMVLYSETRFSGPSVIRIHHTRNIATGVTSKTAIRLSHYAI